MTRVLYIYDEIGKGMAAAFVAELRKVPSAEPITVAINSGGGLVIEAEVVFAALKRHRGEVTVRIDGAAASAASYIAMAGDRIVIANGAYVFIHNPGAEMAGTASVFETAATRLRELETRYAKVYAARTGLPESRVRALMDAESWLPAARAVELGFADEIDTALVTAKSIKGRVVGLDKAPQEIRAMASQGGSGRTDAQKRKLKKRMIVARLQRATLAHKLADADTPRTQEDRRAERQRIRQRAAAAAQRLPGETMRELIDRVMAEVRDQAERAAAKRRQEADYYYDANRIPIEQRRYGR